MSEENNKNLEEKVDDKALESKEVEQNIEVASDRIPFVRVFSSVLIDEVITLAVSGILLLLVGFILKNVFYSYVTNPLGMYFIIYAVVTVLYNLIMLSLKKNATFGNKFSELKLSKIK